MELKKFRVTNFRSVEDSGWIDTERITALIGTNESGKTNIMLPLWKLNPANEGEINLLDDLPRDKYSELRKAAEHLKFIEACYMLDDNEAEDLANISGHQKSELEEVVVSKDYGGNLSWSFPYECDNKLAMKDKVREIIQSILSKIKSDETDSDEENPRTEVDRIQLVLNEGLKSLSGEEEVGILIEAIVEKLGSNTDNGTENTLATGIIKKLKELLDKMDRFPLEENEEVISHLSINMPKFVYYSNYGNLDSNIYLPDAIQKMNSNNLSQRESAKARTVRVLFDFVKLNPQEILEMGKENILNNDPERTEIISRKKEERQVLLESASSNFSKSFNEWWKQGNYKFSFKADGDYFKIWVADSIRPESIELEARSTGLQWFFSFYLVFLVESQRRHKNAILLLDEPGVTLHPSAQEDLFKFFDSLARDNQIIYTTHSPFMVDAGHLERVRSVFIDSTGKTVVSDDLRKSEKLKNKNQIQSVLPVHAALGLSISDVLLNNCKIVLVEGESDQLYLTALKNFLISKNLITPLEELVFIPTGGTKGVKSMSALLSGAKNIKPLVLLDGDGPGINMKKELSKDLYANNKDCIISISEYCAVDKGEIEDIFPGKKIADFISRKLIPNENDDGDSFSDVFKEGEPICDQVKEFCESNNFELETGWKVKLAKLVKIEIERDKGKILSKDDPEIENMVKLFNKFYMLPEVTKA